jgi:enterochelin esterase-like enzyme
LIYDLIPRIDTDYRTIPDRQYRAIGGISRGGNWAIHLGLSYWGFFGSIGAHSTPTFVTDGPKVIRAWLAEIPFDELPRLFLDAGENDTWLAYTLKFEQVLDEEGIPHEWYLFPGYHEEEYWAAHLEQYIRWYAATW